MTVRDDPIVDVADNDLAAEADARSAVALDAELVLALVDPAGDDLGLVLGESEADLWAVISEGRRERDEEDKEEQGRRDREDKHTDFFAFFVFPARRSGGARSAERKNGRRGLQGETAAVVVVVVVETRSRSLAGDLEGLDVGAAAAVAAAGTGTLLTRLTSAAGSRGLMG